MFPQRAKILDLFWWEKVCKQTLIKVIYTSETAFHDSWSTTCEISPLLQCQEGLQVKMLSEILDFLQYLYAVFCLCSVRSALISGVYHDHIQQPDTDASVLHSALPIKPSFPLSSSLQLAPQTGNRCPSFPVSVHGREPGQCMHTHTTIQHKITPPPKTYQDTRTVATADKQTWAHHQKPEVNNKQKYTWAVIYSLYHALRLYGADAFGLEFKRHLSNQTKQFYIIKNATAVPVFNPLTETSAFYY